MFGYIYAEGRYGNIHHFAASKTEAGIKRVALEYIANLAANYGEIPHEGGLAPSKELSAVYAAIKEEDIKRAIVSWNHFSTEILKRTISCHRIDPITFTE